MTTDVVDLRDLKLEAARLLPRGDPVRECLLAEPDVLPEEEGRAVLATYVRLLLKTRGGESVR